MVKPFQDYWHTSELLNPVTISYPVFAMMLKRSGGIAGSGKLSCLTGDMCTATIIHIIVHNACGYVDFFHNVGPNWKVFLYI